MEKVAGQRHAAQQQEPDADPLRLVDESGLLTDRHQAPRFLEGMAALLREPDPRVPEAPAERAEEEIRVLWDEEVCLKEHIQPARTHCRDQEDEPAGGTAGKTW
ncbi:hypothetical protein ACFY41_03705 [Streptomyces syringium]|uniref:hypothetical protein n=1 Tax=Streptomyces syringium TaxID=76729 RepID=UPI0036B6DEB3